MSFVVADQKVYLISVLCLESTITLNMKVVLSNAEDSMLFQLPLQITPSFFLALMNENHHLVT